jgi:hypothetical protein
MRHPVIALTLLAATTALAQTPSSAPLPGAMSPTQAMQAMAMAMAAKVEAYRGDACPVGFTAHKRASGQTVWTISLEDARRSLNGASVRPGNSGVHVELVDGLQSPITQVTFTVFFQEPGLHYQPVAQGSNATPLPLPESQKTFNLSAEGGSSKHLSGDLLVGAGAGIHRVNVTRIDYADGTSWQNDTRCSVTPSNFMLVAQ